VVDIAVIDPRSKVLLTDPNIIANLNTNLSNPGNCDSLNYPFLCDYRSDDHFPGHLPNKWQNTINGIINGTILINGNTLPRPAIQGIRVYERYFYLTR
jgi:hypothetical protein